MHEIKSIGSEMCAAGDRLRRGTLGERLAAIDSAVRESREALAAWADRQRLLLKEQEAELLAKGSDRSGGAFGALGGHLS